MEHVLGCRVVSHTLRNAFETQIKLPWCLDAYLAKVKAGTRGYAGTLPPSFSTAIPLAMQREPCHMTDQQGHVVLVHLPNIIRADLAKVVENAVCELTTKTQLTKKTNGHWRVLEEHFKDNSDKSIMPGVATFSPCWFEVGHPPLHFKPKPSAKIRKSDGSDSGKPFVQAMSEAFALVGAILSIIHPTQFAHGLDAWETIAKVGSTKCEPKYVELMREVLALWSSPFNVALSYATTPPDP
ncbi:hypothetical protein BKA70DRAFT_1431059 [Coprinopsis sp. MPI-PUGE-AT-0042]|nr:hypothetical protein BKA70DRAFT_1431059 [Coprinopsis sp. MPI-PUGE-AT-0042]